MLNRIRTISILLAALVLVGLPTQAAAACQFVPAPHGTVVPWSFPGCFIVVLGWLMCLPERGTADPHEPPPISPELIPVYGPVYCHDCD